MCGGWFASVANFKDNVIPPPNLTRLLVMSLLRTSLSRYLSRALSPRSLYFSVFFCLSKQTDASILMMSCFRPQASMADAWHSHAIHHCPLYTPQTTKSFSSTCMLQTNSCGLFNMRVCALLFFRWRTLQTFACASFKRRYVGELYKDVCATGSDKRSQKACLDCPLATWLTRAASSSSPSWEGCLLPGTPHTSLAS